MQHVRHSIGRTRRVASNSTQFRMTLPLPAPLLYCLCVGELVVEGDPH
jgi:hypothetical protein